MLLKLNDYDNDIEQYALSFKTAVLLNFKFSRPLNRQKIAGVEISTNGNILPGGNCFITNERKW